MKASISDDKKHPFIVFDDVLCEDGLRELQEEIRYLDKFIDLPPEASGSAVNPDGSVRKKNSCLWHNEFYNWQSPNLMKHSPIARIFDKILDAESKARIVETDNVFIPYGDCSPNAVLINKYVDGDYYKPHCDDGFFTAVFFLFDEPKNFEGGDFLLHFGESDVSTEVPVVNNRMVLFPSCYTHEVTEIKYLNENSTPRYSISAFLGRGEKPRY